MDTEFTDINIILKNVAVKYFYAVIVVFSLNSLFYWIQGVDTLKYLTGLFVFIHAFLIFVPLKLNYNAIRPLIPIYLIFISIAIYIFAFLFWESRRATSFMWFLLIPVGSAVFFPTKKVIGWMIYTFCLMCSIFLFSLIIPSELIQIVQLTNHQLFIVDLIVILSCFFLMCFFLYYINRINQILLTRFNYGDTDREDMLDIDVNKYNELYSEIINYIEKNKSYCDPDLTISQLAKMIDTNVTYISRAIKLNGNINFNHFINVYRIQLVKEMLKNDYQNKYTIKFIYNSCGFRHQSTFNKVFKQIEGITPSEHIKEINKTLTEENQIQHDLTDKSEGG